MMNSPIDHRLTGEERKILAMYRRPSLHGLRRQTRLSIQYALGTALFVALGFVYRQPLFGLVVWGVFVLFLAVRLMGARKLAGVMPRIVEKYEEEIGYLRSRRFVVISGLPGSGKTTLGRRLAQDLGLPMLDKDDILEALFDSLGAGDAEWRQRLSRSADEVLRKLAEQTAGAVLTSFWRHPRVTGESGTPTGWLSSLPGKVVEVHCVCSPEIAAERFSARERHEGHLDRDKGQDELIASLTQLAAHGPLGLGPLINVDTCNAIDFDGVLRQLEDHLRA